MNPALRLAIPLFGGAALLWSGGCFTAPKAPRDITHYDPAVKIPAIKIAARAEDRAVVRQLVEDLDDDDPAVRFYAIRALRDLTGENFGYRYYDDEYERLDAVNRWRQWLGEQERVADDTAEGTADDRRAPSGGSP